jgi:WhiB family redox-sensing transcriptional regulator
VNHSWTERAACAGEDLNMFFPDTPNNRASAAKAVCKTCPVINDCLRFALENYEQGVWGGTTDNQRRHLRRGLGIERPKVRPECGTTAAYAAHHRAGEEACPPCRKANAVARARYRENLRLKAL